MQFRLVTKLRGGGDDSIVERNGGHHRVAPRRRVSRDAFIAFASDATSRHFRPKLQFRIVAGSVRCFAFGQRDAIDGAIDELEDRLMPRRPRSMHKILLDIRRVIEIWKIAKRDIRLSGFLRTRFERLDS